LQPNGALPAFQKIRMRLHREPRKETIADGSALGLEVAYFAASVVWRASVTVDPAVRLGPYADEFKAFVQGRETGLKHARLIVHVLDPSRAGWTPSGIGAYPYTFAGPRCREHQFTVPGMTFTFSVGGAMPAVNDEFCFIRTQRVWVIDGQQMTEHISRKLRFATPLGKLGRAR
jgi:hypothetical protein